MIFLCVISWILPSFAFAGHALINHRISLPTAFSWALFCIAIPIIGPLLYLIFGTRLIAPAGRRSETIMPLHDGVEALPSLTRSGCYGQIVQLGERVSSFPLCGGNEILPLSNGAEAYPEMLAALESATQTIAFSTYHFDSDEIGGRFEQALHSAAVRGVSVRILVDFCGAWFHWSSIVLRLRKAGVAACHFNPPTSLGACRRLNFRYHRKLLVIDGRVGFTGGMNIRDSHLIDKNLHRLNQDVHFRVKGPAVHQMQKTFAADWHFASGEALAGDEWFPTLRPAGQSSVRGVVSGPDATLQSSYRMILGALSIARNTVLIITPFFLPDATLLQALCLTALKGVDVRLILSGHNFPIIHWSHLGVIHWLLEAGVRVFVASPPFNHAKLMTVDGWWSLIGSTNWDQRSLKLNFEFDLEVHDPLLAGWIEDKAAAQIKTANEIRLSDLDESKTIVTLRNTLARLICAHL